MRVLLSLLAVSLVLPTAAAQRHRFAQHGDLALVIGVSGLEDLALRPYEGGIGFRYRAADQTVIGAAVALNLQESDVAHRNESGDLLQEQNGDAERQAATFALWAEQHVGRRRRTVSPFVGAGIQVSVGTSEEQSFATYDCPAGECPGGVWTVDESEDLKVGAGLLIGAEIRLVRGVTLGGAYSIGAEYARYETTTTRDYGEDVVVAASERDNWRIGVGTTQLGLSVYF